MRVILLTLWAIAAGVEISSHGTSDAEVRADGSIKAMMRREKDPEESEETGDEVDANAGSDSSDSSDSQVDGPSTLSSSNTSASANSTASANATAAANATGASNATAAANVTGSGENADTSASATDEKSGTDSDASTEEATGSETQSDSGESGDSQSADSSQADSSDNTDSNAESSAGSENQEAENTESTGDGSSNSEESTGDSDSSQSEDGSEQATDETAALINLPGGKPHIHHPGGSKDQGAQPKKSETPHGPVHGAVKTGTSNAKATSKHSKTKTHQHAHARKSASASLLSQDPSTTVTTTYYFTLVSTNKYCANGQSGYKKHVGNYQMKACFEYVLAEKSCGKYFDFGVVDGACDCVPQSHTECKEADAKNYHVYLIQKGGPEAMVEVNDQGMATKVNGKAPQHS